MALPQSSLSLPAVDAPPPESRRHRAIALTVLHGARRIVFVRPRRRSAGIDAAISGASWSKLARAGQLARASSPG